MKTLSNIAITVALSLLVITLVKPDIGNNLIDRFIDSSEVLSDKISEKIQPLVPTEVTSYLQSIKPAVFIVSDREEDLGTVTSDNIVDATNAERIKAGLTPFVVNPKLNASATLKTNDMAEKHYFEHESPTGEDMADLAQEAGYAYVIIAENLAVGNTFADGADVVAEWMNSPGHRANILNPKYREIGVSVAKGFYNGHEVWFAVQHFGTGRDACPVVDAALKQNVDKLEDELSAQLVQITTERAALISPNHPQGEEYRTRVAAFNELVTEYNTTIVVSKEKAERYNAQAAAFNACISEYQTS